jgi:hypothetical protein
MKNVLLLMFFVTAFATVDVSAQCCKAITPACCTPDPTCCMKGSPGATGAINAAKCTPEQQKQCTPGQSKACAAQSSSTPATPAKNTVASVKVMAVKE